MKKIFLLGSTLCLLASPLAHSRSHMVPAPASPLSWTTQLQNTLSNNGSFLLEDQTGKTVMAIHADDPLIPASILKLATTACAMLNLGMDFRFQTGFYFASDHTLYVKGFGDPAITSEELDAIAHTLVQHGARQVARIILDGSYFTPGISIDGQSSSANPYDALNSALLVNFNTINVHKSKSGAVESAEPQTPLTAMTLELAKNLKPGTQRINISRTPEPAMLYVGHLLKAFLEGAGAQVGTSISLGHVPTSLAPLYMHRSSRSLERDIRDLLEHSNNLMTNQLFLTMGAEKYGAPATVEKGQRVMQDCMQEKFGWRGFRIVEGSGLSRLNQVTAAQMMRLVHFFEKHIDLLPNKEPPFIAKTGTLNGVSTLAGFFTTPARKLYRFVLILNQPGINYWTKFKVAKIVYDGLTSQGL